VLRPACAFNAAEGLCAASNIMMAVSVSSSSLAPGRSGYSMSSGGSTLASISTLIGARPGVLGS
jgi:hypothetical protein